MSHIIPTMNALLARHAAIITYSLDFSLSTNSAYLMMLL